jgi:cell wall-associated NlpC family hydrolase
MTPAEYKEMVKIISPLMRVPWKLGSFDPAQGFDCVSFPLYVYEKLGADLPHEFEGLTWETYAEAYQQKPDYPLFLRFLLSLGQKIDPNYRLPGDLLVMAGGDQGEHITAAILLPNQKAVRVDPGLGVMIFPAQLIKDLRGVRRVV